MRSSFSEVKEKPLTLSDFTAQLFHLKASDQTLDILRQPKFETFIKETFGDRYVTDYRYKIFCDSFAMKTNGGLIDSIIEFTRIDIARFMLEKNQQYSTNPKNFIIHLATRYNFLLSHEVILDAITHAINSIADLKILAATVYSFEKNPNIAVKYFLDDYPIPKLIALSAPIDDSPAHTQKQAWVTEIITKDPAKIVLEYAQEYFQLIINGRVSIPSNIYSTFFTNKWIFTKQLLPPKQCENDVMEVEYNRGFKENMLDLIDIPPALIFSFPEPEASIHYKQFIARLKFLVNKSKLIIQESKLPVNTNIDVDITRSQLDSKAEVQIITTPGKSLIFLQKAQGMILAAKVAVGLGLLSEESIRLCAQIVLNESTPATLLQGQKNTKTKALIQYGRWYQYKHPHKKEARDMVRQLNETNLNPQRLNEIADAWENEAVVQSDAKLLKAVHALRS